MEAYKIQETIGEGSFAVVLKATHNVTGETVAMKKIKRKFNSWDECMSLRELKSLRKLTHDNIIKLKEALKVKDELYFVFEYMEQNVYQLYNQLKDSGKSFTENQIRDIMHQTASGLAHMHKHGFFHRDLKPENLLINKGVTKIADFGLAREIRSRPPYTDYVATRWYRAPEIILKSTNYNSPVDIFALGCIMAELYLMAPLFKGNSEMEQMFKICSVLGTPTQTTWNEGLKLAAQAGFSFPDLPAVNLATIIPNASEEAIQLMTEMLRFDPQKRISSQQVLQHPYFANFMPGEKPLLMQMQMPVLDKGMLSARGQKNELNLSGNDYTKKLNNNKENNLTARGLDNEDRLENLDDHLDLLDDLEGSLDKEKAEPEYGVRKLEKKVSMKEMKPLEEESNPDDLLAEIEGYIKTGVLNNNSGRSSQSMIKPALTSVQSGNLRVAPLNYDGGKRGTFDLGTDRGQDVPIYESLTKRNGDALDGYMSKVDKYSMNTNPGNDKYGSKVGSQFGKAPTNMSNRGAHIMNAFVNGNSNNKSNLANDSWSNPRGGQFDRAGKNDW